jgi:3-dehydroquinate dehydratase/shikimate dehydrogenase
MFEQYRWSTIDSSTRVFGLIGDPVAHSVSPLLFNRWFAEAGINAVYLPLRVRGQEDYLDRFLNGCRQRHWLDIGGFSVSIPHKVSALNWLGDRADHTSQAIGALNTLLFHGGKAQGFNTDCHAGLSSLGRALGRGCHELLGVSVDVLGAGGAARALAYGLMMLGCRVTVYGRSPDKTRRMAEQFGIRPAAWEDRVHSRSEVLVNCTSIGMWPDVESSPMPAAAIGKRRMVFDLIYNPLETRLLRDAVLAGAGTLGGLDMFVRQAAMQFELWTSRSVSTLGALRFVTSLIEERASQQS